MTARFELIDDMSDKLADVAASGEALADAFDGIGDRAGNAFDEIADNTASAASSVDGVATSVNAASKETDYWTDSIGNYDKEAMEMIYSLEELVDMGYKSADAFEEQEDAFDLCERMATSLNAAMEGSVDIQNELAEATENANEIMQELCENENVSVETKEELQSASQNAAAAMNELAIAQKAAEDAMAAYDEIIMSGTTDLDELEKAAETACHAAEELQEANQRAADATEDLSKASEEAEKELENLGDQAEETGEQGSSMVTTIAGALEAAGLTKMLMEIVSEVYNLANAFSEAESIIVDATGATGDALAGLEDSMMSSYASNYNDLNTVAGAIGEINTRMGLTGEELSEVTDLFLDFSNITGTNVVSSVQDATKIMNKYNLEADDLESVLNQLAYAGQMSGASVSSLSSTLVTGAATFQNAGFSIENTISLLADFELAGINSSTAVMALRTAVNSFAADGVDVQEGLQNVVEEIAAMEDQTEATALATQVFGSRAGQELSLAIRNGTLSVESFSATLEDADGTIDTTAEASKTLADRWQEANNKISSAFTSELQPAVNGLSSALATVVSGIGDFLNEHPAVTKAITALGVGLGVAVAAFAAYTAATTAASAATAIFGTSLSAVLGPFMAIAGAVSAAVGVFMLLSNAIAANADETEGMTATTREQYYALQDLNDEYEAAVEEYGEFDEETLRLKYQLDDLTEEFENSRQTVEEFRTEVEELCASVDEVAATFDETNASIDGDERAAFALIQKYEDLATKIDRTESEEMQLEAVTKRLNDTYPDLMAGLDDVTEGTEEYAEAMKAACEALAEEERLQQAQDTYIDALLLRDELTEELAEAQENLNLETERLDTLSGKAYKNAVYDISAYQESVDELNAAMEENETLIKSIEESWSVSANAEEKTTENLLSMEEALSFAYEVVQEDVDALCEAYDEAYESALASYQGQFSIFTEVTSLWDEYVSSVKKSYEGVFSLFDEASTQSEEYLAATVSAAQKSLSSQLEYWDTYAANIEALQGLSAEQLGLTEESYQVLMSYISDGSEEAAGLAASMADAVSNGNEAALTELANTASEISEKQEEIAAATAEWADETTGATIESTQAALESQMEYWESYLASIETIKSVSAEDLGLTQENYEALMAYVQDGSEEASQLAASMAEAIESGNEQAITDLGETLAAVTEKQEEAASETAEWQTNFTEEMESYAEEMADIIVNDLDLSEEAAESATKTIEVYAQSIMTGGASAVSAAQSVANQVSAALAGASADISITTSSGSTINRAYAGGTTHSVSTFVAGEQGHELIAMPAHASGTMQGEDFYMAGEHGPELIVGEPGSEVFPRSETDRLIASLQGGQQAGSGASSAEKRIVLQIEGGGSIEIGAGTDTETVLELIQENLKPVLLSILKQEVYEEGDLSYEY